MKSSWLKQIPIYRFYYFLAMIDLSLIASSLFITHENLAVFKESTAGNQQFIEIEKRLEELSLQIAEANAPGNDVFDSHQPKLELRRMLESLGKYELAKEELRKTISPLQPEFQKKLNSIDASMVTMVSEAKLIFSAFERGDTKFAGSRMATMDRKYGELNAALRDFRKSLLKQDQESLHSQSLQQMQLSKYEMALGIILALLFLFVVAYGRSLKAEITGNRNTIKTQELSILESQKLVSLGTMASAIVHEINNPLSILSGKIGLLERHLSSNAMLDEKTLLNIDSCKKMLERLNVIIRGMNTLSRNGSAAEKMEIIGIKNVVTEAIAMVHGKLKEKSVILKFSPQEDFQIEASPMQLSQIIINLVNNAADAVAGMNSRWIQVDVLHTETNMQLLITDSGTGIALENQDSLFEAFHTTKERGKGTGLGLSICKKIAEAHGGTLCYNGQSPNTQFVLTLPLRQAARNSTGKDAMKKSENSNAA